MDCLSPLFLFDQIDNHNDQFLPFSPPPPPPPLFPLNPNPSIPTTRRRKNPPADENPSETNTKNKKLIHRDVERQRRHEMGTLYSSLRSLLPSDYVKGKRSISDHMNEAVKYVKDLQKNMEFLNEKRDGLIRRNTTTSSSSPSCVKLKLKPKLKLNPSPTIISTSKNYIKVESCREKVGIVVNSSVIGGFQLSRILGALMEVEELTVVNCSSTKVNERLLHSIQCEVRNGRKIDQSQLQKKLECLICF